MTSLTERRTLELDLTTADRAEKSSELVRIERAVEKLEGQIESYKESQKEAKGRIDVLAQDRREIAHTLHRGKKSVTVDAKLYVDAPANRMILVAPLLAGELRTVVGVRALQWPERQRELGTGEHELPDAEKWMLEAADQLMARDRIKPFPYIEAEPEETSDDGVPIEEDPLKEDDPTRNDDPNYDFDTDDPNPPRVKRDSDTPAGDTI